MIKLIRRFIISKRIARAYRLKKYLDNPSAWKTGDDCTSGMQLIRRSKGRVLVVPTHTYTNRTIFKTLNR